MTNAAKPDKAFILAAGLGSRLRPYTDTVPKPMVPIAGKSIIQRTLEKLAQNDVRNIVVNMHHLATVLEDHLKNFTESRIHLSREDCLLETGGGIKKALSFFGAEPFYIVNGDALWDDLETEDTALQRLAKAWDASSMDILLLLQPVKSMSPTAASGDYDLMPDGTAVRSKNKTGQYMFAGVRIADPKIFGGVAEDRFSFLALMDIAQEKGRLYGLVHKGEWYHISTPEDYRAIDALFRSRETS